MDSAARSGGISGDEGGKGLIALNGIQVRDFAHPEDTAAMEALKRADWMKKVLDWLAQQENTLRLRTQVLGNCIRVTEEDMPELYGIAREVCTTLDARPTPGLYLYRGYSYRIGIYAGDSPMLIVPDFIVNDFDGAMLRFAFGRAVTALKADTRQLRMLANALLAGVNLLSVPGLGKVALPLIANWSRKAGLTEDRGGLLACQDEEAALRVLMRMAGMPTQYLTPGITDDYLRAYENSPILAKANQYLQTINRAESWNNDRIVKLHQWYASGGYDDILRKYA